MSIIFHPHGLIITPYLSRLYSTARHALDGSDAVEKAAAELLEDILNKQFFNDQNWFVNAQIAPTPRSHKSCDLAISYLRQNDMVKQLFCFIEVKRMKNSSTRKVRELEEQAEDYARIHLDASENRGKEFVYLMTAVGPFVRLWTYRIGTGRVPFWGRLDAGGLDEYYDLGDDSQASEIKDGLETMKLYLPGPQHQPATAALEPELGWSESSSRGEPFQGEETYGLTQVRLKAFEDRKKGKILYNFYPREGDDRQYQTEATAWELSGSQQTLIHREVKVYSNQESVVSNHRARVKGKKRAR